MFTKRNVAKFVKDQVIWTAATSVAGTAINTIVDEPTENQEIAIEVGSTAIGWIAMRSVKSRTDQMIDDFANWRHDRKVAKDIIEAVV